MGDNPKSNLGMGQIIQKVYDAPNDRLRVEAQYTSTIEGEIEVALSAPDDTVAISDGTDILQVNGDGSINVNIVSGSPTSSNAVSTFDTAPSVASGVETTIVTYTVPSGKTGKLNRTEFGGENIAVFNLYLNGDLIHRRRTFFGDGLSEDMNFEGGIDLDDGDVLVLKVLHNRPDSGDFEARIQTTEIG